MNETRNVLFQLPCSVQFLLFSVTNVVATDFSERYSATLDLETVGSVRRFCTLDTEQKSVRYVDAFQKRPLPAVEVLESVKAVAAFDRVWDAFDREYAMFGIKPDVNWSTLRDEFRPLAEAAKNNAELSNVLAKMLANLENLYVYVKVNGAYVPGYNRERFFNASRAAVLPVVGAIRKAASELFWAGRAFSRRPHGRPRHDAVPGDRWRLRIRRRCRSFD